MSTTGLDGGDLAEQVSQAESAIVSYVSGVGCALDAAGDSLAASDIDELIASGADCVHSGPAQRVSQSHVAGLEVVHGAEIFASRLRHQHQVCADLQQPLN